MLEKLKQKAVKMNFKKAVITFLITGVIAAALSGILMYNNFGGRVQEAKAVVEEQRQEYLTELEDAKEQNNNEYTFGEYHHGNRWENESYSSYFERNELSQDNRNQLEQIWNITTTDYVLLGAVSIVGFIFAAIYWILCVVLAVRKSEQAGVKTGIWALATVLLNLWAVAGLYIYTFAKGTCKKCGHLKNKNEMFCSHCGNVFQKKCPDCGQIVKEDAIYCTGCGKELKKSDK